MTTPPKLNHHLRSAEELQSLYDQHGFDQILLKCRETRTSVAQMPMHETFCCKKEYRQFWDVTTDIEVAYIIYQTFRDPARGQRIIIRRLRIGNDIYNLRLP
jgi:hypothetical protein